MIIILKTMDDDSKYVDQAMQQYRDATWDDADFIDLPGEQQHLILQQAQQLKASSEQEKVLAAAA